VGACVILSPMYNPTSVTYGKGALLGYPCNVRQTRVLSCLMSYGCTANSLYLWSTVALCSHLGINQN
jgi:hypothetical protein